MEGREANISLEQIGVIYEHNSRSRNPDTSFY